jgi:hypothetical protein
MTMSVLRAWWNTLRARRRVARAIRILELERTRRRLQIGALVLAFWLGGVVLALLDLAGVMVR